MKPADQRSGRAQADEPCRLADAVRAAMRCRNASAAKRRFCTGGELHALGRCANDTLSSSGVRATWNISRISGQGTAREVRASPVPAGHAALTRRRGGRRPPRAARAAHVREGADPRRRPRQGQVQGARPRRQGRRAPRQDRSTRCARTPTRCSAARWSPSRPARPASEVNRLYITDGADIAKEFYLSHAGRPRPPAASPWSPPTEGGMDIETVAHDTPEKIQHHHHRSGRPASTPHHGRASPSR